jgi:hypothetical protein
LVHGWEGSDQYHHGSGYEENAAQGRSAREIGGIEIPDTSLNHGLALPLAADGGQTFYTGLHTNFETIDAVLPLNGWVAAGETWTYAASDAPSYTFTITGDKTTKYYPGMRIKLTDSTVKYFIITKASYSSPNTTITIYGGTDYTLSGGAITLPYYSMMKAPAGFPLSPAKWTVELSDASGAHQDSPTQNTYYNLGSLSLSIPIGVWNVSFEVIAIVAAASGTMAEMLAGASTAADSFTDSNLKGRAYLGGVTNGIYIGILTRSGVVTLTAKTTYYLVAQTTLADQYIIQFGSATDANTVLRATCAYL